MNLGGGGDVTLSINSGVEEQGLGVCVVGGGLTSGSSWSFGMQAGSTHLTGLFSVEQLLQQQQPQQHRASA